MGVKNKTGGNKAKKQGRNTSLYLPLEKFDFQKTLVKYTLAVKKC